MVDGGGLLQEIVERPPHHVVEVCEYCGIVKQRHGDCQVLVDVGDIVQVLVPHLTGRCPRMCATDHH